MTLRLEKGGRESRTDCTEAASHPLCLVLVLEVMKDSISEGLRRLTPQIIALLCGNIATDPETLKGLKEILNSRTVNSFEPSTCISTSVVYFKQSAARQTWGTILLLLETSKVSKISESTSPARIPHRSNVDHLDEEVLYVDVQ